jgi:hypothetical protein
MVARSGFKTSDQVLGQVVPLFENGAYMPVREYFKWPDNPAGGGTIGP